MAAGKALRSASSGTRKFMRDGLPVAAKPIVSGIRSNLRRDTGGDRRLSGVSRGKSLTVTAKTSRVATTTTVEIKAGPTMQRAQWFWLNEGTNAGPRRIKRGRRAGTIMDHPGTPAKRTWSKAVESSLPGVKSEVERKWQSAIRSG